MGQCDDDIMKLDNTFVYCYCSCGRCVDGVEHPEEPLSKSITPDKGNFAVAAGEAVSTEEMVSTIKQALASATAILTKQDLKNMQDSEAKTQQIADAAFGTSTVVSTAIAEAFAATRIYAATQGDASKAQGRASAVAESVATACAGAYAETLSVAGDDMVALQTETFATDIKTTLVQSYIALEITGDSSVEVTNQAIGRAVAEVVAKATASSYARIAGGDEQAVGRAVVQALTSDELDCPSTCNDNPPNDDYTCAQQKEFGKCGDEFLVGYCECTCETCATGAMATTTTTGELQTSGAEEAAITVLSNAFAEGAKGGDALADNIVEVTAQGNVDVVIDAIAQAYGGGQTSTSALAEALVEAINQGGDDVTVALAEVFAIAQPGEQVEAVSEIIKYSFTIQRPILAGACARVLIVAYNDGGCPNIENILEKARQLTEDKLTFDKTTREQGVPCSSQEEDTMGIEDQLLAAFAENQITSATTSLVDCVRGWVTVPTLVDLFDEVITKRSASCFTIQSAIKGCVDIVKEVPKLVSLMKYSNQVENCMTGDTGVCGRPLFEQPCCVPSSLPLECDCTRMGCRSFYKAPSSIPQIGLKVYQKQTVDCYCPL
eukprot:TRINITY_DN1004_c0_g1_i4.p1 TRINITY_DN1004_c0_g1~~TRINITY_DN1004_c0_g1_i4.p1  ORF type:complete len:691 (+),score=108.86 TRINITY_DN1004_c0_g1_i4:256-2073(+)